MHIKRVLVAVVFAAFLVSHIANADDEDLIKGISFTTSEPEFESSQVNKRDSHDQLSSYTPNLPHQSSYSLNEEPFRPMYTSLYLEGQASTKHETRQATKPQAAEVYYHNQKQPIKNDASKAAVTAPQTPTTLPAHSGIPLTGSFLSSGGGVNHNLNAYRGPFRNHVYQKEQQYVGKNAAAKQESKEPQFTTAYLEPNPPTQKHFYQPQQYKPQLIFQQPHYQHGQQPYHQQIYQAEQPSSVRAIPQHPIQYIIAIPLSHLRQLHQKQTQQRLAENIQEQHYTPANLQISANGEPYSNAQPVKNADNPNISAEPNPNSQHPIQYTQYINLPTSVLHAAVQAAHNYQQQRQFPQDQQQTAPYGHIQPQFLHYPQHQQRIRQQILEQNQHAPIFVSPPPEKQKLRQELALPQKEVRILPTPVPANVPTIPAPLADPTPIVNYNPVYVQAPPSDQQTLFGGANYHRFTSGAYQATTPVPLIRLSPVTQPYSHYYTPHHTAHIHQHIHPVYRTFVPELPSHNLPYFMHPGGVHYGTHLYHPTAFNYVGSHSLMPAKNTETVNNKQQQQNSQRSGASHTGTSAEPNTLVKYP